MSNDRISLKSLNARFINKSMKKKNNKKISVLLFLYTTEHTVHTKDFTMIYFVKTMIFYYSYLYEKNRTGMYLVILIIVVKGHERPILWKKKGILVTKYVNETKEEHGLTRLGVPYAGNRDLE